MRKCRETIAKQSQSHLIAIANDCKAVAKRPQSDFKAIAQRSHRDRKGVAKRLHSESPDDHHIITQTTIFTYMTLFYQVLIKEGALKALVSSMSNTELNCQRYSALALANLATTVAAQVKIIQSGAVKPLIAMALDAKNQVNMNEIA
jgi:hypothetical protein